MNESQHWSTDRACEDCGTALVVGPIPRDVALADPDTAAEQEYADWCPNLDCPSNHVITGLTRTGVRRYICTHCQLKLDGPVSQVFAHRRSH